MGYIANLYDQKIELHQYYFHVDKEIDLWIVHFPLIKNNFNYTVNHRKMEYGVPYIWNHEIEIDKTSNGYQVKYYQA